MHHGCAICVHTHSGTSSCCSSFQLIPLVLGDGAPVHFGLSLAPREGVSSSGTYLQRMCSSFGLHSHVSCGHATSNTKVTPARVHFAYLCSMLKQAALERKDLPFACLAIHELESIQHHSCQAQACTQVQRTSKKKLPQASRCNSAEGTSTAAATWTLVHSFAHPAAQRTHDMLHYPTTGCKATKLLQSHLQT